MFVHHCSSCEKHQLIFPSQITGVARTEDRQLAYAIECWCGAEQTHVQSSFIAAA